MFQKPNIQTFDIMNENLRSYLFLAGALGVVYWLYNHFSHKTLSLKMTQKIAQQIKQQMMIVTINFAEGISKHAINSSEKLKDYRVNDYFVEELSKIYRQKEDLILSKYTIPEETYAISLARYARDSKIRQINDEILDMMQRSINGIIPDLTVPTEAFQSFTKQELKAIYLEMCVMASKKVTEKLQSEKARNPSFDPNDDLVFRSVIRQLSIYDLKATLLLQRGFKQSWGCPNQIFFKISETHKQKDGEFRARMAKIQKNYERVIEIICRNPYKLTLEQIQQYFSERDSESSVSRSGGRGGSGRPKVQVPEISQSEKKQARNSKPMIEDVISEPSKAKNAIFEASESIKGQEQQIKQNSSLPEASQLANQPQNRRSSIFNPYIKIQQNERQKQQSQTHKPSRISPAEKKQPQPDATTPTTNNFAQKLLQQQSDKPPK